MLVQWFEFTSSYDGRSDYDEMIDSKEILSPFVSLKNNNNDLIESKSSHRHRLDNALKKRLELSSNAEGKSEISKLHVERPKRSNTRAANREDCCTHFSVVTSTIIVRLSAYISSLLSSVKLKSFHDKILSIFHLQNIKRNHSFPHADDRILTILNKSNYSGITNTTNNIKFYPLQAKKDFITKIRTKRNFHSFINESTSENHEFPLPSQNSSVGTSGRTARPASAPPPYASYLPYSSVRAVDPPKPRIPRVSLDGKGATLLIRNVHKEDQAEYRCTIHYRKSPSLTHRLRLEVQSKYGGRPFTTIRVCLWLIASGWRFRVSTAADHSLQ